MARIELTGFGDWLRTIEVIPSFRQALYERPGQTSPHGTRGRQRHPVGGTGDAQSSNIKRGTLNPLVPVPTGGSIINVIADEARHQAANRSIWRIAA